MSAHAHQRRYLLDSIVEFVKDNLVEILVDSIDAPVVNLRLSRQRPAAVQHAGWSDSQVTFGVYEVGVSGRNPHKNLVRQMRTNAPKGAKLK